MPDRCDAHSKRLRHILITLPLALLTSCIQPNQAVSPPIDTFQSTSLAPGITLWTNATTKTYVIEADLSKAELRSISGTPTATGKVGQMKFEEFWAKNNSVGNLQVLVNGTFFQTYNKPTGIAFGLKQDKQLITYGYGLNEFPTKTMTVSWSSGQISIDPYRRTTFDGIMPNVVGALDPTAGKNADQRLPRTFIGVKNQHNDADTYGTVLLLISPGASQGEAEQTLRNLGAKHVAMLDGGRSTGLIIGGKTIIQPKTRLPQTIGIFTK
jgi:Phosphodiester glycosidase